jgi:SAM-dependent methyltransferase
MDVLKAVRAQTPKPVLALADVSVGAARWATANVKAALGTESSYGIFPGYTHRAEPSYFDDTGFEDGWQREVYEFAAELMARDGLTRVADVGCGSGFKLMKYLGLYDTVGYDVPETVQFLKGKYPERAWHSVPFETRGLPKPDLVVSSDVIEHVPNPDALLGFIAGLDSKYVIISTPDRDCLYRPGSRHHFGPPPNTTHLREWSFAELGAYVGLSFEIIEHKITNREQGTQMIFARNKAKAAA